MTVARVLAVAAVLALLAPRSAFPAEEVLVRATQHGKNGFGRITFIWPAPVGYQARLDGTTLTVHFARPMSARLDAIPKHLGRYVSYVRLRPDSATVVARLRHEATLHSFASGNSVAVDIAPKRQRAAAVDKMEKAERADKPERADKADKADKAERADKAPDAAARGNEDASAIARRVVQVIEQQSHVRATKKARDRRAD